MKILHIINAFEGGGAEKLLHDTVLGQKKLGINVEVFVLSKENNHYLNALQKENINVYISKCKSIYSFGQIRELRKIISKNNHDIIHVHLFPALYWASIASLFISKKHKLVYTEHSTFNRRRDKRYLKPIESFIYRQYKRIFCISASTEHNLHQWVPHTTGKTKVIANGINLNDYIQATSLDRKMLFPGIDENDKLIVMVASFSQQKDYSTLVKSLKYLDSSYKLLLVGIGSGMEDIKSLANSEEVSKQILFLGFRKDIPRILKTSNMFVLSSHWEGFGLVAVEAMSSGLPVLVSNVEGLRDVVGRSDMTFPQGNSEMLSKKIKNILLNEDKKKELINYGFKRSKEFSIESMVSQLEEEYSKLNRN